MRQGEGQASKQEQTEHLRVEANVQRLGAGLVVAGWLGSVSTTLHCINHGSTCRLKRHQSVFLFFSGQLCTVSQINGRATHRTPPVAEQIATRADRLLTQANGVNAQDGRWVAGGVKCTPKVSGGIVSLPLCFMPPLSATVPRDHNNSQPARRVSTFSVGPQIAFL